MRYLRSVVDITVQKESLSSTRPSSALSEDGDEPSYVLYSTMHFIIFKNEDPFDPYDGGFELLETKGLHFFRLTPFVAVLLIAEDWDLDFIDVDDVHTDSNACGDIMQPEDANDDLLDDLHRKNIKAMNGSNNAFFSQPPPRQRKRNIICLEDAEDNSLSDKSKPKTESVRPRVKANAGTLSVEDFVEVPSPKAKSKASKEEIEKKEGDASKCQTTRPLASRLSSSHSMSQHRKSKNPEVLKVAQDIQEIVEGLDPAVANRWFHYKPNARSSKQQENYSPLPSPEKLPQKRKAEAVKSEPIDLSLDSDDSDCAAASSSRTATRFWLEMGSDISSLEIHTNAVEWLSETEPVIATVMMMLRHRRGRADKSPLTNLLISPSFTKPARWTLPVASTSCRPSESTEASRAARGHLENMLLILDLLHDALVAPSAAPDGCLARLDTVTLAPPIALTHGHRALRPAPAPHLRLAPLWHAAQHSQTSPSRRPSHPRPCTAPRAPHLHRTCACTPPPPRSAAASAPRTSSSRSRSPASPTGIESAGRGVRPTPPSRLESASQGGHHRRGDESANRPGRVKRSTSTGRWRAARARGDIEPSAGIDAMGGRRESGAGHSESGADIGATCVEAASRACTQGVAAITGPPRGARAVSAWQGTGTMRGGSFATLPR
ncbi:hypothetical protein B0H14DRAFT_2577881 [Mycena olivaceomarginata]|nr:hypothetical protein B0H14DRAFT_2577881 [Mycena olivaceomarginata]